MHPCGQACRQPYAYSALQYAWDEPNLAHAISFDDRRLKIGENLLQTPLQLWQGDLTELLCVDAVCISQIDSDEY
jgi:hypothetical protein